MREELIGFLLGALDAEAEAQVAQRLQNDPQLRADLELAQRSLRVLPQDRSWVEPPPGLCQRTCDFVLAHVAEANGPATGRATAGGLAAADLAGRHPARKSLGGVPKPAFSPSPEFGSEGAAWSMADLFVVAGVCLTAALLFAPALITSQVVSQRNLCASNLRIISNAVHGYAQLNDGRLPAIPNDGPRAFSGIVAVQLVDNQLITDPGVLWCPELCQSGIAIGQGGQLSCVATERQILLASEDELSQIRMTAGGNYSFALPYRNEAGELVQQRDLPTSHTVILGDDLQPVNFPTQGVLRRHGGEATNVLFLDGRVNFQKHFRLGNDDLYRNDRGQIEAGRSRFDQVLAPSPVRP